MTDNLQNSGCLPDESGLPAGLGGVEIEICGLDLAFRPVHIPDRTPTGRQIAAAEGLRNIEDASVLFFLESGELEDIGLNQVVKVGDAARFIVVDSDSSYRLRINGQRFDWPRAVISGAQVRTLGEIPSEMAVYLERADEADRQIGRQSLVNLAASGVEVFYSREATWILNVQGVRLALHEPEITVRQAMIDAGFDVTQGWHIYLKVSGEPKREVQLDTVIDLRHPGIEKLRLTQRDVSNGEASVDLRTDFALLDVDEDFLDAHFVNWETVVDEQRRWLMIHDYPLPPGYSSARVTLALEIPPTYPAAQIDMFYLHPSVQLKSGATLPNTEVVVQIEGLNYQRWSRHRGAAAPWRESTDNVITHLALVESALRKEIEA
jgi:hypothetical protein